MSLNEFDSLEPPLERRATGLALAPVPVPVVQIESLLDELRTICRNATLDAAMAVGRLIVDRLYAGELATWRHRGVKDASFRKLVRHPQLPISAGTLYRSVAIYELCQRLETKAWKHVSASHLRLVLPLAAAEQAEMLRAAEQHGWPARRLEQEIALLRLRRPPNRSRGGRRAYSRLKKALKTIERCLDGENNLVGASDADATPSSPESTRSTINSLRRIANACRKLEHRLEQGLPDARSDCPPPLTRERDEQPELSAYVLDGTRFSRLMGPGPK